MDIIAEVRRRHLVSGESISSIARSLKISRPTVRKHLSTEIEPVYNRAPNLSLSWVHLNRYCLTGWKLIISYQRTNAVLRNVYLKV